MKLTDEEKRKLIQFSDDDEPHIRSMKAELQMLYDMAPGERRVFVQEERVRDEQRHLQWMIDSNKHDDDVTIEFAARAKRYVNDYQLFGDTVALEAAKSYAEIAKLTKQNKYSIADIRKQRERIWQEKKRLIQIKNTESDKPKPSSSPSQT